MNGRMRKWFAQQAFGMLRNNPEFAQRFEREFGMSVDDMQRGYEAGDEKFCSAIKRRGEEERMKNPAAYAQIERMAGMGSGNFPGPGGLGIPNKNTTTN